jgi:hypothetical protein
MTSAGTIPPGPAEKSSAACDSELELELALFKIVG